MTLYMKKLLSALAVAAMYLPLSAAAGTYSMTSPGTDQSWSSNAGLFEIGRFSLQSDIVDIVDLNTSVTLRDQGWGGHDPTNGVHVRLFAGETILYSLHVAGASHDWKTDYYSLTAHPTDFAGMNAALDNAQWGAGVTVRMYTDAWVYPGWELHTRDVSLNMASGVIAAVPEPSSYVMLVGGLGLLGGAAWRRRSKTMA